MPDKPTFGGKFRIHAFTQSDMKAELARRVQSG